MRNTITRRCSRQAILEVHEGAILPANVYGLSVLVWDKSVLLQNIQSVNQCNLHLDVTHRT